MADQNKENPSEAKDSGETKEEMDEDEEEVEFSFDLPGEWMVIDVDDGDEEGEIVEFDLLSQASRSSNQRPSTNKSQAKEPQNSYKAKPSSNTNQKGPKRLTEKPRDLKEKASLKDLLSSEKLDSAGKSASPMKASTSAGKSMLTVDSPRVNTRATRSANSKAVNEKTLAGLQKTEQTTKDCSGKTNDKINQSPKTSKPETSASLTKTASFQKNQKPPEKNSSGKTANTINNTCKSSNPETSASLTKTVSYQKPQKPPEKASAGKTTNSINHTSKTPQLEPCASSIKTASPQKAAKLPDKTTSGKLDNSSNQISKSSHPESSASSTKSPSSQKVPNKTSSGVSQTTQVQKATSCKTSSKKLSSVEKAYEGTILPQVSGKKKDATPAKEKIPVSKSDNKSTAVKVTSSSAASVSSKSVSTSVNKLPKERMVTSETKTLTKHERVFDSAALSDQVTTSSASDAVLKTQGVPERIRNDGQKNNPLRSPDSNKISQKDVRVSDVAPVGQKLSHVDHGKQKSAQKQTKPMRNSEIAEAMEAGDIIELCDIQVHDLDSEEPGIEKKMVQSKPVPSAGLSPKKRPSQSSCETIVKKAKYEEKVTDVHCQDSAGFSGMHKDEIKESNSDVKDLSVQKQSAKRIVRRFHRTTQTISKMTANQLLQCSLGHPPSGSSSKKHQNNSGIQCKIGENFEDVISRISSHLTPVVNTLNQEVFKAVLAFDASLAHQDIVTPGTYKYGIRLGQVSHSDLEKNFFKDNCIKKADSYTVSFWTKDCGIVDFLFYEEENFISVINQFRKSRLESRYLCVSMVQRKTNDEKDSENLWDYLKATVIFDQNFVSTGYLSYYKSPIWSKPKVDEFITMHNVPGGIPLSFLNLVFPDAVTVLMRDVKVKFTLKGGGVRLGMSRKNGSGVFLKLFKQVLINNSPVVLTQGLSDKNNLPEVKEASRVVAELEKVERERQKEKLCLRSVTATPRDINYDSKKKTKTEGKGSSVRNISSYGDNLKKDAIKGSEEAPHEIDSDLSDISELSFNATNFDNIKEGGKPNKANQGPPQKKIDANREPHQKKIEANQEPHQKKNEPKRSLNVTMGSKLLSRARTNLHQAQSKRQEKPSGKKPVTPRETRRSPDRGANRNRKDSPRRSDTMSNRFNVSRRDESRHRDEPRNRGSDNLQNERLRNRRSIENRSIDRSSAGSGSRHGQRICRDMDLNRSKHDQSPVRHFRRPRSSNRSSEREVLLRSSNRLTRSPERHGGGMRMREGEGNSNMEFGLHSSPIIDSHDRRISLGNPSEIISDLKKSSEDLRAVLDARKPRHIRLSPRRPGSEERIKFDSPGRQRRSRSPERRKRPLSRSPSPRYRKVMIERQSLSPRNRSRRQRGSVSPQPHKRQFLRPGMDAVAMDTMRSKTSDFRSVQAPAQSHGSGEQASKEESMRISKSLFVKLLTNALHGEGEDVIDENPSRSAKSYSPLREETGRMLSQIRSHETKEERSFGNYLHTDQRRPDFEEDRKRYGPSGSSKGNFEQSSMSGADVRPIPPPVLPPILTSTSMSTNFPVRPHGEGPNSSTSQISQGVWAAPSSAPFSFPSNVRPPFPPPNREAPPPPQNPFNTQPPVMFMNTRPPFQPPQGPVPNIPQGMPPPRAGMWQTPRQGPF